MEKTRKEKTKTIRSNEAIDIVLTALGLTREDLSTYKEYSFPNGEYLRLRISDHGLFLQNWFEANKMKRVIDPSVPKMNAGYNLAITFPPTEEECNEKHLSFPVKIKNVTKVKTAKGNNVKPQYSVRHICYYTWKLNTDDLNKITVALKTITKEGGTYYEPIQDCNKYIEWIDTSNIPPKKINK